MDHEVIRFDISPKIKAPSVATKYLCEEVVDRKLFHYSDVIMSAMASQNTGDPIVYSTVCSVVDKKNIKAPRHWLCDGNPPVDSPKKGPVTR